MMSTIGTSMVEDIGQTAESSLQQVSVASRRETNDDYHAVITVLNDRWRVIDSCEPYPYRQWILQYHGSLKRPHSWTTTPPFGSFCQTRRVLERCIREKAGVINPAVVSVIASLPEKLR
jgi:hypothetical protein